MDCVYHAYTDYMEWRGTPATRWDFIHWKFLKRYTHGSVPQYTFGGVTPWIINRLWRPHQLHAVTLWKVYSPDHYREVVHQCYPERERRLLSIIDDTNWWWIGEDWNHIIYFPAIYLLLTQQHAVFSEYVPKSGIPVMAIYYRANRKGETE